MSVYKNEYDKNTDYMMWELHEKRQEFVEKLKSPDKINKAAKEIVAKYKLKGLKFENPQRKVMAMP